MPNKKDSNNLLNPASAVESYFDTLLQKEAAAEQPTAPVKPAENLLIMPGLEKELANIDQPPKKAVVNEARQVRQQTQPETNQAAPEPEQRLAEQAKTDQPVSGPDSHDFPLQCLMFNVQGNQLSIPLIEMGSVLNWDEHMTRLPNSPPWFLGLVKHRGRNVKVVDSAVLLDIDSDPNQDHHPHILVFAEDDWAITCDKLGDVVKLSKDDVKWRAAQANSLSMGTIKKSLAMLLSPANILDYLNRSEKSYS